MDEREKIKLEKVLELKKSFIVRFNNENRLKTLTEIIDDAHYNIAINELLNELNIGEIPNYQELRRIALKIKHQQAKEIFMEVCQNNRAEDWLKDNGQYYKIVVDAYIKVFKKSQEAIDNIKKTNQKIH